MAVWNRPIDFFARRVHFIDHIAPVWKALPPEKRGVFFVPAFLEEYALEKHGIQARGLINPDRNDMIMVSPSGMGPLFTCAYGDLVLAQKASANRPNILMEHGVGLTFKHPGYAGGFGLRTKVKLFLAPNEFIRAKTGQALPSTPQAVVGTPKLDMWGTPDPLRPSATSPMRRGRKPVVCISFHWDGSRVCTEAGNAWKHYMHILPMLAKESGFKLIGHGHPKIIDRLEHDYAKAGIEVVRDFDEVLERADLYVNDCSSTMYEFCVTGKPVIILNAPWFRKFVNYGIRFWLWTDMGPQVEQADDLLQAIEGQLRDPDEYRPAREKMVRELYPFLGVSAQRAAEALVEFCATGQVSNLESEYAN